MLRILLNYIKSDIIQGRECFVSHTHVSITVTDSDTVRKFQRLHKLACCLRLIFMYNTVNTPIYTHINSIDRYTYTSIQGNRANVPNRSVAHYKMTLHGTIERRKKIKMQVNAGRGNIFNLIYYVTRLLWQYFQGCMYC